MEEELRLRVNRDSPEGQLIRWLKSRKDGRTMALYAIRAFWLADQDSSQQSAWECWNALAQQTNYLAMRHGLRTAPPSTISPTSSIEESELQKRQQVNLSTSLSRNGKAEAKTLINQMYPQSLSQE